MRFYVPPFLKHVTISKAQVKRVAPFIRNWLRMFDAYKDLDKSEIELYLIIELNYKQRKSVLDRLMGRYMKLLKEELIAQIVSEIGCEFKTGRPFAINPHIERLIDKYADEDTTS